MGRLNKNVSRIEVKTRSSISKQKEGAQAQDNQTTEDKSKKEPKADKKAIGSNAGEGLKTLGYGVMALGIAAIAYGLSYLALGGSIGFYARHIISFIIAILCLSAFAAVTEFKGNRKVGTAVFIFMLVIFIYSMTKAPGDQKSSKTVSSSDVIVLDYGTKVFEMKKDEETPWLSFPEGVVTDYTIASPTEDYTIEFSDGKKYLGTDTIPIKKHPLLKIRSNIKQVVKVSVR